MKFNFLVQCTNYVSSKKDLKKSVNRLIKSKTTFGVAKTEAGFVVCRDLTDEDKQDADFVADVYKNLRKLPFSDEFVDLWNNGKKVLDETNIDSRLSSENQ